MVYKLGFIGAGNMAEAIARGSLAARVLTAGEMVAFDPSPARREVLRTLGVAIAPDNEQVIAQSQQVMLAIKPQMLGTISELLACIAVNRQVIISIMAGISTDQIAQAVGDRGVRVVRVMPNTPLMVGLGMAGVALGRAARQGDDELTMKIFGAAGKAIRVPEAALDAITAVSGSGPAYLFYLAEAMERAAAELGLAQDARLLVQQTLIGAATLFLQSPDPAAELRRKVTSPGGTTEAAIKSMEAAGVSQAIVEAIHAAAKRSKELGH